MNGSATVVDTTGRFAGSTAQIAADAVAGLNAWGGYLVNAAGAVEIEVRLVEPGETAYASGGSVNLYFTGLAGGVRVAETVAGLELRTGIDANGSTADIRINLNVDSLSASGTMWINPLTGAATPAGKVDLVSILAHEIGHGLGFTGLRDEATYALSTPGEETGFDANVVVIDGRPYFSGANAVALYGGAVPLTTGNLYHLGNGSGIGSDLRSDLMFETARAGATPVSALDARVLSDLGVPTIFNDRLAGLVGADTIDAGAGADTVNAAAGADNILGGDGDDYLRGEDGNDRIVGGAGFDDINGNLGDDTASGGPGSDWVVGGQQNDLLSGDEGGDIVYGNLGSDWCDGGEGDDLIRGGQHDDRLLGQGGADWLSGDRGADTLTGGPGADTFHSFGEAGIDLITDFSALEGDRVRLDPGSTYTLRQSGADTVIDLAGGAQVILAGVPLSSLAGDWIVVG